MKAAFGALCWTSLIVVGWQIADEIPEGVRRSFGRAESELWRSVISSSPEVQARFPQRAKLSHGDGVFAVRDGELQRIGEVCGLEADGDDLVATLRFDAVRADLELTQNTRIVKQTQRQTFEYCLEILVTEPRRREIQALSREFLRRHEAQFREQLQRLLPGLLAASRDFLVGEIEQILSNHGPELQELLEHYRTELAQEHAMPLLVEEVWPIVEDEIGEPAQILGRALWERAPLFDFAWRAAWDTVLSDGPDKVESAWKDFLEDEAVPVMKDHEELIRATLARVLRRVVASEAVRSELQQFAAGAVKDPRLHAVGRQVIEEMLVDNPRLIRFLRERWDDPQLREELAEVNGPLQDTLAKVGNLLVFDDSDSDRINPDLAKLLRLLLLHKDQHYLLLQGEDGPALEAGGELEGRVQS